MWGDSAINDPKKIEGYIKENPDKAMQNVMDVISALQYHQDSFITKVLQKQRQRVADSFRDMENLQDGTTDYIGGKGTVPYKKTNLESA